MPLPPQQLDIIFYDGHCGLCHRAVRFILRHDRSGTAFRFAPLQGETFRARIPADWRDKLPDSMVVETGDASLLVRSEACIYVLRQLGGGWRIAAAVVAVIPHPLRDALYDLIARTRYRFIGRRSDLCPVVTPELRNRFDP